MHNYLHDSTTLHPDMVRRTRRLNPNVPLASYDSRSVYWVEFMKPIQGNQVSLNVPPVL